MTASRIQIYGGVPIFLNALFILLLYIFFGSSEAVTIYFSTQFIVLNLSMLLVSFSEQFVHYYAQERLKAKRAELLNQILIVIIGVGFFFVFLTLLFSEYIVKFFFNNFDDSILILINRSLQISIVQVFFYPVLSILKSVLITEKNLVLPFAVNVFYPTSALLSLWFVYIFQIESLNIVLIFQGFATVLSFVFLFGKTKKVLKLVFDFRISRKVVWPVIGNSIAMRSSGSIYTLGFSYLLASVLSGFAPAYFAIYSYLDKILAAFFAAVNTGLQSVAISKVSDIVRLKKVGDLIDYSRFFYKRTLTPLSGGFVIGICFLLLMKFTPNFLRLEELNIRFVMVLYVVLFYAKIINHILSFPVIVVQATKLIKPFLFANACILIGTLIYRNFSSDFLTTIVVWSSIEFVCVFYYFRVIKSYFES